MALHLPRRRFLQGMGAGAVLAGLPRAARASATPEFHDASLPNGMRVVIYRDNRIPLVTHELWYRVGAGDEQPGVSGIAHFFEHLMFKGTARNPGATFNRFVDRLGGAQNAFTTMDATYYVQRMPKRHLSDLMALEADRMTNLQLTDSDLSTELGAVLEEKRGNETNVSTLYFNGLRRVLYPQHRVGIPIIGVEAELRAMSRETLLAFYRRYYAPNNAILVVGGDVQVDEVMQLAAQHFGGVPASTTLPVRQRPPAPPLASQDPFRFETDRVTALSTSVYFRLPQLADVPIADKAPLGALATLSSGFGFEHGAYRRLVQDRRLASNAWGSYSGSMSGGELSFGFQALPGMTEDTARRLLDETLDAVRNNIPDDAALADVATQSLASDIKASDSSAAVVTGVGTMLSRGQDLAEYTSYRDRLAEVRRADIRRVIDTYMTPERALIGTMVPKAA